MISFTSYVNSAFTQLIISYFPKDAAQEIKGNKKTSFLLLGLFYQKHLLQ